MTQRRLSAASIVAALCASLLSACNSSASLMPNAAMGTVESQRMTPQEHELLIAQLHKRIKHIFDAQVRTQRLTQDGPRTRSNACCRSAMRSAVASRPMANRTRRWSYGGRPWLAIVYATARLCVPPQL